MQREGTCRRANTATCPFRAIESRTHPETRFSSLLITPPRATRGGRRGAAVRPPRVPTAQRRLCVPRPNQRVRLARAHAAAAPTGAVFFSPLRPAGASSVTELRRKQVHSAEVGSARPDPKRGNRCERRAFRNATPPRPGQDSATPRTRTHLRLGGTGRWRDPVHKHSLVTRLPVGFSLHEAGSASREHVARRHGGLLGARTPVDERRCRRGPR